MARDNFISQLRREWPRFEAICRSALMRVFYGCLRVFYFFFCHRRRNRLQVIERLELLNQDPGLDVLNGASVLSEGEGKRLNGLKPDSAVEK
jgi:hypothetical protein